MVNIWWVFVAAAGAGVLTIVAVKFLDHLRRRDAESEARSIIEKAQRESVNLKKEAELQTKEAAIVMKAEGERELSKIRHELHERERLLDKRQDTVEQQADQVRKQEKMVENNQRKLAEKLDELNRRNEELNKLLDMHRQTLHQLSGLSREEATHKLLDMLDLELQAEQGQMIQKFERKLAEICDSKARDMLLTSVQRYAAAHTAETTTSTVYIPNDEMMGRIIGREGRNIRAF